MSQSVNLSVSGLYTSQSDLNGLPQGALDAAVNVESRYKNILSPRRGFQGITDSDLTATKIIKGTNFPIEGDDTEIILTDDGDLFYYDVTALPNPWTALPGISTGILPPNSLNGKSRFFKAGQNLYLTSQDGLKSLSSGETAEMLRAGVPKGLNLEAETNGDTSGFFSNNEVVTVDGTVDNADPYSINEVFDVTGIEVGQYVTTAPYAAFNQFNGGGGSVTEYLAVTAGAAGNSITVAYIGGGTAGAEVVTVVGTAITVQIQNGVSTANQVRTAVTASVPASALVTVTVLSGGGGAQSTFGATALLYGADSLFPTGTVVTAIEAAAPVIVQTGDTTAGSPTIANVADISLVTLGMVVSGRGIPENARVASTSGAGPYTVDLDSDAYETQTGVSLTYSSTNTITVDEVNVAPPLFGPIATSITFYSGAQVGYRMVFGRVETDINSGTITRLGAPSSIAIANNILPTSTNVTVTGTLPKNAEGEITFVQLYRSAQTESNDITPLDQYNLVYERALTNTDFSNRVVTITDEVPDSLVGIPLYCGSDREGILQANNPPPMCWDFCTFRDFALFANATQPSTLKFTILSVGSPDGIQVDDTITIAGSFLGTPFTETYTAKSAENAASRQFKVYSSGTPSQNITDTAASLIRVINYDEDLPVHAISLSTSTDLPGQMVLESDQPSLDTFTATASAHASAYDPVLTDVSSEVNTLSNGVYVSKSSELEAVPALNLIYVGDSSSPILRVVPLRDYVVVLKTDGIYKIQGLTASTVTANPFDLTTKIIGADTAVSLNSAVWMLSNQGVVAISDGGVEAKSIPIDNQLNQLIGTYLEALQDQAFAIGYESDRKYILSVPTSDIAYTDLQYVFNYITNTWTNWDRNLQTAFIHSNDGLLYIATADSANESLSKERKSGTFRDYVDEALDITIVSVDDLVVTLNSVSEVEIGDVLYQSSSLFSFIVAVDAESNTVTVSNPIAFTAGSAQVLQAYECTITWKQVFGDNPAFMRQFQEGLALFKNTRFSVAELTFQTDFSRGGESVEITGLPGAFWGALPWGDGPWGGSSLPTNIRFLIPQNKQCASYLIPTLTVKQVYSDFIFQGLSISYENISQEAGR
jgi:hypothetical protein